MFRRYAFFILLLWLAAAVVPAAGQQRLIPGRQFLKQFGPAEGLAAPFIYALAQDRQGYLWIGTAEGLVRYDGTEFRSYTTKDGLAEDFVTGLRLEATTGRLLLTHYQGSHSWQLGTRFETLKAPAQPGLPIPDTAATGWQRRLTSQLPAGTVVSCTLVDAEGNRWLGTAGQGLWRLTDAHVTLFALPAAFNPVALNYVRTEKALIGGTFTGRLLRLAPTPGGLLVSDRNARVGAAVVAFGREQGDVSRIQVGTAGRGLYVLNTSAGTRLDSVVRYTSLPPDLHVAALATDRRTGDWWVGTIGEGAYRLRRGQARAEHFTTANGLLHNDVYALLADRQGRVWFGAHGTGLVARAADGQFQVHRLQPGGEDVTALHEDDAGRIWVGTEGDGLYCLENNRFRQYSTRQGLPSNYCYGLLNLPGQDLLIVHRNGLSCFSGRTRTFRALTSEANPLLRDLLPNALLRDAAGTVWLASRGGLVRVAASPLAAATPPLALAIPAVEIDGAPRHAPSFAGQSLGQLTARQHQLGFRFRAASLAPAGTWQYQHRLRGYVPSWSVPASQNEAQFPRLDAGEYVFEVRARRGEQGVWSAPAAVRFSIATPFWRTWWFAALGLVATGAGIWAFVRGREAVLRQQKLQLETTVRRRTRQLRKQKAHIEDMNAELTVARDVAEASRKAKAQFLANMSHEIRTPMNAVIGLTHLLRQTPVNGEQREYLEAVQSSSQNLLVIINDILDSSKIEAGKMTLEHTPFRLPELLRRVASMFRFATDSKQLFFRLDIAPGVPAAVFGDPVRLNQILVNLVGNAIKFTTTGGVTVRVSVADGSDPARPVVRFAVHDTGIGIPADKLDAIFEDFSQANASTTRQFGGTGLGLSIARNLVELHGGQLSVESQDGAGSVFRFAIPYEAADPAAVPAETSLIVGRFEPALHVLVAEDNELNQLVARKTLEAWNVHVTVAANGRLAVEAAATDHFDAVLMDVQMPEMDGYEASRQLRTRFPDARQFPIIGLTASALPEDRALALEAGMNDTLAKPFDPAVLFDRLARHTGRPTAATEPSAPAGPASASSASSPVCPDWTLLEELAGGNEPFIHQIISTFLAQAPLLLQELAAALSRADTDSLARTAHKLKGQVAYFGAHSLHGTLEELEHQAAQPAQLPAMATSLRQIEGQLQALYVPLRARKDCS